MKAKIFPNMKGILKTLILVCGALVAISSCKPDIYKGPLDNPYGNWLGVHTDYFFNSETVAQTDACGYSVISFYRQGLCCIEGHKGTLPFSYDHESSSLEVGQDRWTVTTLTGAEMVLEFIETVIPEPEPDDNGGEETDTDDGSGNSSEDGSGNGDGTENGDNQENGDGNEDGLDDNGIKLPAEFKGMTITSDGTAYFYTDKNGKQIRCYFVGTKDENGTTRVDFWFDTHTDRFVPYNLID